MVAYSSSTSVVLILRASETYFAPSAPRSFKPRLHTRAEWESQWLLTARFGWAAAYSRVTNEEFVLRASDKCFAPSAPRLLNRRLQTRVERRC